MEHFWHGYIQLYYIYSMQARKNREISALQRKIDEVPSRAELSQYQRRFIELYNQGRPVNQECDIGTDYPFASVRLEDRKHCVRSVSTIN